MRFINADKQTEREINVNVLLRVLKLRKIHKFNVKFWLNLKTVMKKPKQSLNVRQNAAFTTITHTHTPHAQNKHVDLSVYVTL